ncbi:metallophosphoesterase family protein [Niallia taxi]|uniref:metallophosphoesterase family protein n=1 Tax=Niallia taxi TaxID=2499688 RepID=UPI002E24C112|nr:metallophosphoesterase [Niallia taxi]MED3963404.1 metallophosphoesterase family protein [Niallia taxi]
MKMAVIADVHGNLPALKAVFSALDLRKDVKHIYCLGDMIGIGPNSNEVLHLLFSRKDVSMITGNHYEAVLALAKGEEYPKSHSSVRRHYQWILDRLDKSFIPHLENSPRRMIQNFKAILYYSVTINSKNTSRISLLVKIHLVPLFHLQKIILKNCLETITKN